MIFLLVSLRRVAPNTSEQRSRSGLCKRVIRREATETEGLVLIKRKGRIKREHLKRKNYKNEKQQFNISVDSLCQIETQQSIFLEYPL